MAVEGSVQWQGEASANSYIQRTVCRTWGWVRKRVAMSIAGEDAYSES